MAKYIIDIPDEVPVSDELVPFDMCRPSWYWEAYKEGKTVAEDEVWDFARAINYLGYDDFVSCFGGKTEEMVYELSYSEVKAEYDAWKKQKGEIRVGDEVVYAGDPNKEKAIVLRLYQPKQYKPIADIWWHDGAIETKVTVKKLVRTGRHFDIVEDLLKKMRDADDNHRISGHR